MPLVNDRFPQAIFTTRLTLASGAARPGAKRLLDDRTRAHRFRRRDPLDDTRAEP
ncbi:MAG: hypothetical protein WCK47_04005 [bacterium]|nr:hypothetical protein [Candidatus Sumerlaeota bacterium]